jgi:hypothetical protein
MRDTQLVMYDEDYRRILGVVQRSCAMRTPRAIFVVDRNGQLIAEAGEMRGIDTTSLASLTAGCIARRAAREARRRRRLPGPLPPGPARQPAHHAVSHRIILVVVFDDRSSLGLVRLRVKKAGAELAKVFEDIQKKTERRRRAGGTPFSEITDDDIDNLFSV